MCLLSGEPTTPVGGRPWSVLPQAGCGGRYVPEAETEAEAEAELASERSSTELVASSDGGFEAWLRRHVCEASATEVNVHLGDLTLNQHHMTLLEAAVASHPDLLEAIGGGGAQGRRGGGGAGAQARFQSVEVRRSEHRRQLRLLGLELDLEIWSATPAAWAARHPAHAAHAAHAAGSSALGKASHAAAAAAAAAAATTGAEPRAAALAALASCDASIALARIASDTLARNASAAWPPAARLCAAETVSHCTWVG